MNCSSHKKEVAGISDMKVLAEMIGDLNYETLADFLKCLSLKLYSDGRKDFHADRQRLGLRLMDAAELLSKGYEAMESAWQISKPFMEDKSQPTN